MKFFLSIALCLLAVVSVTDWVLAEPKVAANNGVPVLRDSNEKVDPQFLSDRQEFMAMQEAYGSCPQDVVVSSTQMSKVPNRYAAKHMGDFDTNTAWVEGHPGHGIGESISFTWREKNHFHTCGALVLMNGYQKSKETMTGNSRVKSMDLYVDGELKARLALQDRLGYQRFGLMGLDLLEGQSIRLVIQEVYKGTKWKDTCISELIVECVP